MTISSANEGLSRRTRRAHTQFSEFIKGSSTSQLQQTQAVIPESPSISKSPLKKRGKKNITAAELESIDASAVSAIPPPAPRKSRKTITTSAPDGVTETIPAVQPTLEPSESISTQSHGRTTRLSRRRSGSSTTALPVTLDLPRKSRKVILLVTQPENALDQLLQRAQEPLPSSFTSTDGKRNSTVSKLQAHAKAASVLAETRAELRRCSAYLPLDRNKERRRGPPDEPKRRGDTWDVILKAVEAAYRTEPLHIAVTRRICEAVRARAELNLYGQVTQSRLMRGTAKTKATKKQRDDPETAWRKKLAKATAELVVDQWKRVVLASVICVIWVARVHLCEFSLVCPRETEGGGRGRGEEAWTGAS